MIQSRLLLALDQFDAGEAAVDFTIGHAAPCGAEVTVLHVREVPPTVRIPPLESTAAARDLVEQAVLRLRGAGVPATGIVLSAREDTVAKAIVEVATDELCDGIVLGSLRHRGHPQAVRLRCTRPCPGRPTCRYSSRRCRSTAPPGPGRGSSAPRPAPDVPRERVEGRASHAARTSLSPSSGPVATGGGPVPAGTSGTGGSPAPRPSS